jgi:nitrogen-specific signal transduction histidine kinase
MSKVNIKRVVENIRANTTVYTPVVEMIVNAIQAIYEAGRKEGKVQVRAQRSSQVEPDGSLLAVMGFDIEDNGIGFTDAQRNSFDTLYTDRKIAEGGKGFGRFTGLKYFEDLRVKSVYHDGALPIDYGAR